MANQNGTMKIASATTVMITVAMVLLPPTRRWTWSISVQVATTIVVAQISAPRNGSIVHRLPTISAPMNSTSRVERVRSFWTWEFMTAPDWQWELSLRRQG